MSLPFDVSVPDNGYAWWYIDVLDPESDLGLTAIVFIGSVFSPHYARARMRGDVDPEQHCALNVALYRRGGKRWVMSEFKACTRDAEHLSMGQTVLRGRDTLVLEFDARTAPFRQPVKGRITVTPQCAPHAERTLDPAGAHRWWPVAPVAHATVELDQPALRFEGEAYHDCNRGDRPLEADFARWSWSRVRQGGRAQVLYDCVFADGSARRAGWRMGAAEEALSADEETDLGRCGWGLPRPTRHPEGAPVSLVRTLEDTPFYNRSWVRQGDAHGVHEFLDLERFSRGWVRFLLPFKTWRV